MKMFEKSSVHLREWKTQDAPDLTVAINNKKVLDNLRDGIPYPYTEKDALEFIGAMLSAPKDTQYAFAICYDGKAIGSIGVFRKENVHRFTAEMGYYIAEPYWGKGITTEAIKQMCSYIFENTDIVRIFAEPYATNHASCRVLEKSGFQFEGVLRQNAIKNGQMMDMKIYAILKPPSIRHLRESDVVPAMELVWRVFSEFEAPDYSDEGVAEFKKFITPDHIKGKMESGELRLWGAFEHDKIIGVIAIRPPLHIALLFVDREYHRRGIARSLFYTVTSDKAVIQKHDRMTVYSSPYAVEAYRRLGFIPTDSEQTTNGMRFTPMECILRGD